MSPAHPNRSALYIPASHARALEKARGLACDIIIFDLEDAVAPEAKVEARATLKAALDQGYGYRRALVRINALDTEWGPEDAIAAAAMDCDGVLLPKVNCAADVDRLADLIPGKAIWVMMETPLAMLNAGEIAAHERVAGFVMGTNDLAKEIGSRYRPDRLPMMAGLGLCILAAKANAIVILDGVYNAFKDQNGLRTECEQGRDLGMDGKTLIHPAQLAVANEVFAPSESEIEEARRQIEAFQAAQAEGKGVAVVDGRIVENLHIVTAKALLAKAAAIAAMEE